MNEEQRRRRRPDLAVGRGRDDSSASTALVTLHYGSETADVLVQDDGCGLPEDFTVTDVPREGRHQGLASLSQRLARLGGHVILQGNEDGGMTLCASLPTG